MVSCPDAAVWKHTMLLSILSANEDLEDQPSRHESFFLCFLACPSLGFIHGLHGPHHMHIERTGVALKPRGTYSLHHAVTICQASRQRCAPRGLPGSHAHTHVNREEPYPPTFWFLELCPGVTMTNLLCSPWYLSLRQYSHARVPDRSPLEITAVHDFDVRSGSEASLPPSSNWRWMQ